jgi:hypothetical protein
MRDLSEGNQRVAQVNVDMKEGLGEDRWNPFDERCVVVVRVMSFG